MRLHGDFRSVGRWFSGLETVERAHASKHTSTISSQIRTISKTWEGLESMMEQNAESFYRELLNVELNVPCSSWNDEVYCLKNFGSDWKINSVRGIVKKIKISRKSKEPSFEIQFPDKKGDKTFSGYKLDYIWKHSVDVPLKYHQLKADYIMKSSNEAALLEAVPQLPLGTSEAELKKSADDTGNLKHR